jgi:hypothetical protein
MFLAFLFIFTQTWVASEVAAEEIVADKRETRLTAMGRCVSGTAMMRLGNEVVSRGLWLAQTIWQVGEDVGASQCHDCDGAKDRGLDGPSMRTCGRVFLDAKRL